MEILLKWPHYLGWRAKIGSSSIRVVSFGILASRILPLLPCSCHGRSHPPPLDSASGPTQQSSNLTNQNPARSQGGLSRERLWAWGAPGGTRGPPGGGSGKRRAPVPVSCGEAGRWAGGVGVTGGESGGGLGGCRADLKRGSGPGLSIEDSTNRRAGRRPRVVELPFGIAQIVHTTTFPLFPLTP